MKKFDKYVGVCLVITGLCLFLLFYLHGFARAFPLAGIMFFAGFSGVYALCKSFKDGIFPGRRYAPVVRRTDPIKFWISCAVSFVFVLFCFGISIWSFLVGFSQVLLN